MLVFVVKIKINSMKMILIKLLLCVERLVNLLFIFVRFNVFIIEYKIVIFIMKKDDDIMLIRIYFIVFCSWIFVELIINKK